MHHLSVQLPDEPFAFPLQALIEDLAPLVDKRARRGRRYQLAPLIAIAVLAKLAKHSQLREIAHWAKLRQDELTELLGLERRTMPHPSTWSRIFSCALDPAELDRLIGEFFSGLLADGPAREGDIAINIDGKTLRGTIPSGATQEVHLVAAYLPGSGFVLAQLEVGLKANEITVAPSLLAQIELNVAAVSGDAMFAQRKLSALIISGGGNYLWKVKANQPELLGDIELLFLPLRKPERERAYDWRTARMVQKGHGHLEEREIEISGALAGYSDWPGLAQVYKLTCRTQYLGTGKTTHSVHYGVTSLSASQADAARVMSLELGHWGIEGGLHQRRDVSLGEDRSQVRMGKAPHVLASLNNVVVGLASHLGEANLASLQRSFAYRFDKALHRYHEKAHAGG